MRKRRILLVDDEAAITRALAMYLTENGDCEVCVENKGSRALAAGFQAHLSKPIEPTAIIAAISELLRQRAHVEGRSPDAAHVPPLTA